LFQSFITWKPWLFWVLGNVSNGDLPMVKGKIVSGPADLLNLRPLKTRGRSYFVFLKMFANWHLINLLNMLKIFLTILILYSWRCSEYVRNVLKFLVVALMKRTAEKKWCGSGYKESAVCTFVCNI
jgi:hypothetical protein